MSDAIERSTRRPEWSSAWAAYVVDRAGVDDEYAWPAAVAVEGEDAGGSVTAPDALLGAGGPAAVIRTSAGSQVRLVVDFGRVVSGYAELGIVSATGAPIRVAYSEAVQYLGRDGDAATDPDNFFYQGYTLGSDAKPDGRVDVFEPPLEPVMLRSAALRGAQRYIGISLDGPGTAALDFIRVATTNRRSDYSGYFLCDDDLLNRAWYASAHTLALATIRSRKRNPAARWVIVDGPKRDRLAYGANLGVAGVTGYSLDAGYREIVRDTLNLFAWQQEPDGTLPAASEIDVPSRLGDPGPPVGAPEGFGPPAEAGLARLDSYAAWWVVCLDEYLRYTGDSEFVAPLLPVARRVIGLLDAHAGDDHLTRNDLYGKTYTINWHPPDPAIGADAWENASYVGALRALAALERRVAADAAAAQALEARADTVRAALVDRLWDDPVGAMRQNTEAPDVDHTGDASTGAVYFGLLDDDRARRALTHLGERLASPHGTLTTTRADNAYMTRFISPFILVQEAMARIRHGDDAAALRLVRQCWGAMLRFGPGTVWEQVGPDGAPGGAGTVGGGGTSLAHPWSSAVPVLTTGILGVAPEEDGFRTWRVEPHLADLRWAEGRVPVPGGSLAVRWRRASDDQSFELSVEAPAGTVGRVVVPLLGADRTIARDGAIVWDDDHAVDPATARRAGDTVVVEGVTGSATFAW